MSNYSKTTNFLAKDSLISGDPAKVVKGSEHDTEYTNIATAITSKADASGTAITSGAINGTTIGASTPSTGAFTTLSATGLITASAGETIASGQTLTLTGATVAGAPTWASTQTLNTSGNAATVTTNANLTGGVTSVGNAATVVTNANLTGGVTSVGNAATVVTNANLTGPITSTGNATAITSGNTYATPTLTGTVTVTGTTITGAPTWSSTQAMNISGSSASTTGNAATATALQTARTINGVSFDGTANISIPGGITLVAEQATTSGTSIDFTSIPSGVKQITIMFSGVSTSGTSPLIIQIGDSGGIETSGYTSLAAIVTSSPSITSSTAGFVLTNAIISGTDTYHGAITLFLENTSTNNWASSGNLYRASNLGLCVSAGTKATSAVLDRVRITTAGGTDTFDAGVSSINYQ